MRKCNLEYVFSVFTTNISNKIKTIVFYYYLKCFYFFFGKFLLEIFLFLANKKLNSFKAHKNFFIKLLPNFGLKNT